LFGLPDYVRRADIFSHGGARRAVERLGVEFLGELRFKLEIRELADAATPIVMAQPESDEAQTYRRIADGVWERRRNKHGR
jgi:ATP-binding protein involved in chromosome partitioning